VQEKETTKRLVIAEARDVPSHGRLIAIDPGTKRIGVAVCDELRITIRRLPIIQRSSWKKLLAKIKDILDEYDAAALIVGLPYNSDGSESEMSAEARRMAGNFAASLDVPVFLQDERVTTYEARGRLWAAGVTAGEMAKRLDSEAAAIILEDFLDRVKS
jgi:putative holliday junction resolvase